MKGCGSSGKALSARRSEHPIWSGIAAVGTEVEVAGISSPDRDSGRLREFRCAIQAVEANIHAEDAGFDAYVMGHFQEPGLHELRSALPIPVIGTGTVTLFAASQLGLRLGLIPLGSAFEVRHCGQAQPYGLSGRQVIGMGCQREDFERCFAGDDATKARLLESFRACAQHMVEASAVVTVPAVGLPGPLIGGEPGLSINHVPVVDCGSVAPKSAEMWVQLRALSSLEPSRSASFCLAGELAEQDLSAAGPRGTSSFS